MRAVWGWLAAAAAGVAILLVGACVDFPLLEPADPDIPVVGARLTLWRGDALGAERLEFEGYIYGHVVEAGHRYQRFLDAGTITVGGQPAQQRFPRPAEPLYYYAGTAADLASPVRLEISGSDAVAPCVLKLDLPLLRWPAHPGAIPRGQDLVLPLDFGHARPTPDDQISAQVRLIGSTGTARGTVVALELHTVESEVVVPARLLEALPPGEVRFLVDVLWERTRTFAGDAASCVPRVTVQATVHSDRRLHLE